MNDLELRLTDLLARKADEVDVRPVDGFAEAPYTTALATTDLDSVIETCDPTTFDREPTHANPAPRRRSRRVGRGLLAAACAAAVVAVVAVVVSLDGASTTVDTRAPTAAATPLEEPSRQEVSFASNAGAYVPGSGPTGITAARRYVSLRTCALANPDERCERPEGWAYVTGSTDTPEEHYGLLGNADSLVLSAIDDRYFVASAPSSSTQDPASASPAWLIDSVTGRRGALTWRDQPTTLNSVEQELVLSPVPHLVADYPQSSQRSLPRILDRRDWTIRPLSVPDDASPALAIHQPGSGRIWIGTAPDGGDVGLAYTDDGGASWTDVELPESLRLTSAELLQNVATPREEGSLVVAASGDHVAVTAKWDSEPGELFVSADSGASWNTFALDSAYGSGRGLFVLSDDRLLLVSSSVLGEPTGRPGTTVTETLRVSRSAADWSQLERSTGGISEVVSVADTAVEVNEQRVVVVYDVRANFDPNPVQHRSRRLLDPPRPRRDRTTTSRPSLLPRLLRASRKTARERIDSGRPASDGKGNRATDAAEPANRPAAGRPPRIRQSDDSAVQLVQLGDVVHLIPPRVAEKVGWILGSAFRDRARPNAAFRRTAPASGPPTGESQITSLDLTGRAPSVVARSAT